MLEVAPARQFYESGLARQAARPSLGLLRSIKCSELSTAAIYAELAKPFPEQSMKIRHMPVRTGSGPELYEAWTRRQTKPA